MKQITGTVTVNYKDAQGAEKSATEPVTYLEFETASDVFSFLQGNEVKGADGTVIAAKLEDTKDGDKVVTVADQLKARLADVLGDLNYGVNLSARSTIRNRIQNALEGPDKTINAMVKQIMKARQIAGKPVTEATARKMALLTLEMESEATEATPESVTQ